MKPSQRWDKGGRRRRVGSAVMAVSPSFFREQVLGKDGTEPDPYPEEMIPSILILKLKHQKRVLLRELPSLMTKTKGQGSRGNVPPTNRKKVSPRTSV